MPEVLIPAELKGKKGIKEIMMLANSGSDYTILPESNEERREEVEAVILKGQEEPLAGISTLEKLGVLLDMKNGKFRLIWII